MIAGVNTFTQEIQKLIHAGDKQKVIHERKKSKSNYKENWNIGHLITDSVFKQSIFFNF